MIILLFFYHEKKDFRKQKFKIITEKKKVFDKGIDFFIAEIRGSFDTRSAVI